MRYGFTDLLKASFGPYREMSDYDMAQYLSGEIGVPYVHEGLLNRVASHILRQDEEGIRQTLHKLSEYFSARTEGSGKDRAFALRSRILDQRYGELYDGVSQLRKSLQEKKAIGSKAWKSISENIRTST